MINGSEARYQALRREARQRLVEAERNFDSNRLDPHARNRLQAARENVSAMY